MNHLKVIFEDESILIIDKPAGLVVDRSETQKGEVLADILQNEFGIALERGGIVHRLDKDTSGLLLVAKTQQALENLQLQFQERKVKKEYLALVHGLVAEGGRVEGAIGRNPGDRQKFTVILDHPEGGFVAREAVTEYEPVKSYQLSAVSFQQIFSDFNKIQMRKLERIGYGNFTLVSAKPLTGRTHQIRVHLKYINHPVVGDEKYVGRKVYRLDHRWVGRQFLHAKKIGFYHPISDKWMELESQLPEDLQTALKRLEYG